MYVCLSVNLSIYLSVGDDRHWREETVDGDQLEGLKFLAERDMRSLHRVRKFFTNFLRIKNGGVEQSV